MGLLITFVLGLFILIGVFLVKISKNTKLIENLSISVALGCMISLAVSDLFPEIYETFSNKIYLIIIFVVIGVLILKLLDIFTFISIATANKKFDIKHIIKYLLKESLPLFIHNKILASIIIIPPITFLITNFSFKKIKPNITRKTLESCLSIEKVDGLSPYLASIFNLSVNA